MRLNNNTRLAVLLGKPLGQSLSVCLQNATYKAENINMVYLAEETEREDLGPVLNGLRRMNFAGCGVTKPYKVDVMEFLDELDPLCEKIGACNTIVNCSAALRIFDGLPIDKREGIQDTYLLLAHAVLTKNAMQDGCIRAETAELCRQSAEKSLMYTKKWYGESFATAVSHENLGYILLITSQYEDAAENFKQAQYIFQKLGLEQDAEKQNGFLETVAGCMESGDTGGGWELHSIDEFDNLTLNK